MPGRNCGIVDESNIAVTGWSYGGYMTSWLIGHAQFWKAAIAGAPVTNLVDQYTLSDSNVSRATAIGGSPYTGDWMKHFVEQSPITYYDKMVTPTLVLQDVGDYRVTITQGIPALPRAQRPRRQDLVLCLSHRRPQPQRPGPHARRLPPLDRMARPLPGARVVFSGPHEVASTAASVWKEKMCRTRGSACLISG